MHARFVPATNCKYICSDYIGSIGKYTFNNYTCNGFENQHWSAGHLLCCLDSGIDFALGCFCQYNFEHRTSECTIYLQNEYIKVLNVFLIQTKIRKDAWKQKQVQHK